MTTSTTLKGGIGEREEGGGRKEEEGGRWEEGIEERIAPLWTDRTFASSVWVQCSVVGLEFRVGMGPRAWGLGSRV
eukprot:3886354-Rhodomonas_salina.1